MDAAGIIECIEMLRLGCDVWRDGNHTEQYWTVYLAGSIMQQWACYYTAHLPSCSCFNAKLA